MFKVKGTKNRPDTATTVIAQNNLPCHYLKNNMLNLKKPFDIRPERNWQKLSKKVLYVDFYPYIKDTQTYKGKLFQKMG